jgi:RimJ/RimL family protein N-acetyltransferase
MVHELPEESIAGPGVLLRPARLADADQITAACADPAIQRFVPGLANPYTRSDAVTWITDGRTAARAAGGLTLVMADPDTDQVLGSAAVHHVDRFDCVCELGYWVAPWARGRGLATSATATLSRWAHEHGVHRVELCTDPVNWPSQRVAIAAGFRREGVRRAAGRARDESRYDLVLWARVASDPPGPTPRLLPDLPAGTLGDGTILLRPLWTEDTQNLYQLQSLPEFVASHVPPEAPRWDQVLRRCAEAPSMWLAGERAELTIRDTATGEFAGQIGLYYQEPTTGQAMIGYGMLPQWRGKGYATRAVRLLADWAFQQVGIARLIAGTAPENVASQRVLERVGFLREGYLHSRLPGAGGGRIDDLLYALLP